MHTWQRGFGSFGPMTKVSSRVSFYCYIIRSAVSLKNWVHSNVCNIELVTGSLEDFKIIFKKNQTSSKLCGTEKTANSVCTASASFFEFWFHSTANLIKKVEIYL